MEINILKYFLSNLNITKVLNIIKINIIKEKKKMNFCGYCGANLKTGEKTWRK